MRLSLKNERLIHCSSERLPPANRRDALRRPFQQSFSEFRLYLIEMDIVYGSNGNLKFRRLGSCGRIEKPDAPRACRAFGRNDVLDLIWQRKIAQNYFDKTPNVVTEHRKAVRVTASA
jgi:hypothetical protein